MTKSLMKRLGLIGSTAFALLAASPAAATEYLFDFSGTGFFGGSLNGSGTLTTNDQSFVNALNGQTAQAIAGITGPLIVRRSPASRPACSAPTTCLI